MTEVELYGDLAARLVKALEAINNRLRNLDDIEMTLEKIEQHIDHFLKEADELDAMKQ